MMAGIRGKNTEPELLVRKALFAAGYRFRLHRKDLPGSPDVVMPGRKLAIFVHGCFWHAHPGCALVKLPSTRPAFWGAKLARNRSRDVDAIADLQGQGWRVLVVWECFIRRNKDVQLLATLLRDRVESRDMFSELSA